VLDQSDKFILVTGGAGYIGSHAARALAARGFVPVTYDNLIHGHRWAVQYGPFVEGDIGDRAKLLETIRRYKISAAIHFAAFAYVGESVKQPAKYFDNNVTRSLILLDALLDSRVRHVVFSSSCATYGLPDRMPIAEDAPQHPMNPYGETKLIIERALRWYAAAYEFTFVTLRYFNAAGADPDGKLGEVHSPETHLIPLALEAIDGRGPLEVYGGDYPTPDGTCVRDYIHVADLADAHVRALDYLQRGGASIVLNLGTGTGHSVREVIRAAEEVTGRRVPHTIVSRRAGDPAILVADPSLACKVLAWHSQHSDLGCIVRSAWKWHSEYLGKQLV
jgi:UDP-glucose-4-epimerase GalE